MLSPDFYEQFDVLTFTVSKSLTKFIEVVIVSLNLLYIWRLTITRYLFIVLRSSGNSINAPIDVSLVQYFVVY